jgi:hypothetical protein
MQELQTLEIPNLFDLLVKLTQDYTRLLKVGTIEEFTRCKLHLTAVQAELESRKRSGFQFSKSGDYSLGLGYITEAN